jgi:hypothetical protein
MPEMVQVEVPLGASILNYSYRALAFDGQNFHTIHWVGEGRIPQKIEVPAGWEVRWQTLKKG